MYPYIVISGDRLLKYFERTIHSISLKTTIILYYWNQAMFNVSMNVMWFFLLHVFCIIFFNYCLFKSLIADICCLIDCVVIFFFLISIFYIFCTVCTCNIYSRFTSTSTKYIYICSKISNIACYILVFTNCTQYTSKFGIDLKWPDNN